MYKGARWRPQSHAVLDERGVTSLAESPMASSGASSANQGVPAIRESP